jgi:hypothetical protein
MRTLPHLPIAALIVTAGVVVFACGGSGASPAASPAPATTAAPAPASANPGFVELDNATGNDVAIEIVDESGSLIAATSGTPGDGASVEPYTVAVTNEDPTTLRLTWVDGPCDALDQLMIDATGRRFLVVQPECAGDSVAYDRVLLMTFAESIDAADVAATLQDGLDTATE